MLSTLQNGALLSAILLSSASAGVVVSRAATDICGKKGYDQGKGNYYYSANSKVNTYAACSAKCAADATCKSFGYGEACLLFNIPVSGNFEADNRSKDIYYDKVWPVLLFDELCEDDELDHRQDNNIKRCDSDFLESLKLQQLLRKDIYHNVYSVGSTTSATSGVTVPSGCPAPAAVELTNLNWFNSTHNLDCPNPNYPSGAQVCFDSTHVCVDEFDGVAGGPKVCSCTPYCYTGLPAPAYQPFGYGPPDTITINLDDPIVSSCSARMPTGFRDFEIGSGHVNCGNAQDTIEFYGDSNKDSGSTGTLNFNGYVYSSYAACKGTPHYSGNFPLSCTRDVGGNATCTLAEGRATLTLLSFT